MITQSSLSPINVLQRAEDLALFAEHNGFEIKTPADIRKVMSAYLKVTIEGEDKLKAQLFEAHHNK